MQHYSNSMLLPFEKIVSQSKYQELFSKSFEDIAMEFTKITDYTEPYSILRKLNQNLFSLLQKGEHEIALPLKLIKPISEISKVPIMDIFEELEQLDVSIQDKIKNEDIISESYFDRLLYTGLLELSFFEPLMKGLFRKYQPGEQYYERLFSPTTRPHRQSCGCDWQAQENNTKDPESCSSCSAHTAFFSHSSIIIHRNFSQHANQPLPPNRRKALEESFHNQQFIWKEVKTSDMVKIAATIYHLLGCNKFLWDKPSYTVKDIWENYPSTVSIDEMSETLNRLMSGREWKDYVDLKGRKNNLITELKNGKVITIYGEGATGKTELVYQSLDDIVNSGDFSFDYLLPFTFKGNQQGELNDKGELTDVNHQGWDAKSEFTQILDVLSSKCSIPIRDGTDSDERFQRAADFLATQKVCMIVDNHETVDANDPERSFDRLLKEFTEHPDFSSSHTRIILTTRVKPDEKRIGKSIKMKYLSFEEMSQLSRLRSNWLAINNRDRGFHLNLHQENENHWIDLQNWLTDELNHQLEIELAGHPRVVFIAVYAAMFKNEQRKSLKEIIKHLIEDARRGQNSEDSPNPLRNLMTYISSRSFTYIPDVESNYQVIAELAKLHEFSDNELIMYCTQGHVHYSKLKQDLSNLNLIIETETGYSFRTRYHSQDLLEFLNETYGPFKAEGSRFKWWSSKLQDMNLRPIPWNKLQHLTINNPGQSTEEIPTTIRENLLLLEDEQFTQVNFDSVINLVSCLRICLEQINSTQDTHKILADKDSRAYLQNFELFCLLSIKSAIIGLSKLPKPEITLPLNQFNSLTNMIHKMFNSIKQESTRPTSWIEVEESLHVLMSIFCITSRKYSNDTSASLHTLWNLSKSYLEEHPQYAICVGNRLLNHAGRNTDQEIMQTIFDIDLNSEKYEMKPLVKFLQPYGKYLWHNSDYSLESTDVKKFLDPLLELEPNGVFSKLEKIVNDIHVSKEILSGTIANTVNKISIKSINNLKYNPAEVEVQILAVVSETDGEEFFERFLCRHLEIREVKKTSTDSPITSVDNNRSIEMTSQNHKRRKLSGISRDEMWELLSSHPFTKILASDLLGPQLRRIAKEKGFTGTWAKWKKKHFRRASFPQIIDTISEGSWSTREVKENVWSISRGSRPFSENELAAFTEKFQKFLDSDQAIGMGFDLARTRVRKHSHKSTIKGRHIKPFRGTARRFNQVKEEE
jgi:hypothetical protein